MRGAVIFFLIIALGLSWLWFFTNPRGQTTGIASQAAPDDTVTVWVSELLGSPDEAYYYSLANLWNSIEPRIHIKMCVLGYSGYDSKLRVAIASGQPPDVSFGGMATLESLQYSGKTDDLSVPIPPKYFPDSRLAEFSPKLRKALDPDANGRPRVFPIWRYAYGGILLANNDMLKAAGFNDQQIRDHGWTINQFREACRRMTHDGHYGFGAALVHLPHLFLDEFGPGIWGRNVSRDELLGYNKAQKRWTIHPALTEDNIYRVFSLFNDLINVDKSWDPATLSMSFPSIIDNITVHRTLGMTFGETPWVPMLRQEIWKTNEALGVHQLPPPPLTAIWMPAEKPGQKGTPRAGIIGFSVMKQIPYKGDAHTDDALRVGLFLTHPVMLARSQIRTFRHLPADPKEFAEIYPELLHMDNPWVKFYNDVMNSDIPVISNAPGPDDPGAAQFAELQQKVTEWFNTRGMDLLQQVIYQKIGVREGAATFYRELKALDSAKSSS
ncbi:MAG TPA: ABC transporter substrate-binding protein [Tepidisphaeraceae bacterium]|nr:ABC transporter substrate-binding protein [Tepidisphaeraceae bacterium]